MSSLAIVVSCNVHVCVLRRRIRRVEIEIYLYMNWVVSLGAVERRDPMNLQKLSRFSFLCSFCGPDDGCQPFVVPEPERSEGRVVSLRKTQPFPVCLLKSSARSHT